MRDLETIKTSMATATKEIPSGYKQTDVGVIPEDWEVKILDSVAFFKNGKAHEQYIDERGDFVVINAKFISTEGIVRKHSKQNITPLKKGDITIVMSDIPNGKAIAKCFFVKADDRYTLNQRIGGITPKDEIDDIYLFYKLNRNHYYLAFDSGIGQTNIKRQDILDCPIAFPPTKSEQTAIATALSDMDALIAAQEQLIAKKRAIKQGAMQELLEKKEGWEDDEIQNLCRITTGAKNTQDRIENGKYPFYVRSMTVERINSYSYDGEAVLTAGDGVGTGKVFHYINEKFDIHQRVYMMCEFNYRLNGSYFFHYFSSHFYNRIHQMTAKSSVDSVRRDMIAKMVIPLPPLTEQTRIATILSDMDTEIEQLGVELGKYRDMKKGMMGELLTGKKRLKH